MLHLADWFFARLNSKEDIDLQCLRNSRNSLAQGQMFNSFGKGAALTAVSTAGV
jgi:predicted secreted hydrolase